MRELWGEAWDQMDRVREYVAGDLEWPDSGAGGAGETARFGRSVGWGRARLCRLLAGGAGGALGCCCGCSWRLMNLLRALAQCWA